MLIAAVQVICQASIERVVLGQVSIQKVHRYGVARNAANLIAPSANCNLSSFQTDAGSRGDLLQILRLVPLIGDLTLVTIWLENLPKIPLAMQQRDRHYGDFKIGGRSKGIACQHS